MILALHIVIAVFSLVFAAYGFFAPSKTKLSVNYVLLVLTLVSGSYLVVSAPAHMTEGCMMGLFYTLIMIGASIATKRKLQAERA